MQPRCLQFLDHSLRYPVSLLEDCTITTAPNTSSFDTKDITINGEGFEFYKGFLAESPPCGWDRGRVSCVKIHLLPQCHVRDNEPFPQNIFNPLMCTHHLLEVLTSQHMNFGDTVKLQSGHILCDLVYLHNLFKGSNSKVKWVLKTPSAHRVGRNTN